MRESAGEVRSTSARPKFSTNYGICILQGLISSALRLNHRQLKPAQCVDLMHLLAYGCFAYLALTRYVGLRAPVVIHRPDEQFPALGQGLDEPRDLHFDLRLLLEYPQRL